MAQKLGTLIQEYRESRGWSLRRLADETDNVMSRKFLHDIERGKWLPSEERLNKFCESLELPKGKYFEAWHYSKLTKFL